MTNSKQQRSPLAPMRFPQLPQIAGARFASAAAGVRYHDRADVALATLQPGTVIAGVFTRSSTRAACVIDCQNKIGEDATNGAAILVNAGNANAFTGRAGVQSVARLCTTLAAKTDIPSQRIFTSSTGVIGELLPTASIEASLSDLVERQSPDQLADMAQAILTTDTFAKGAARRVEIDGRVVQLAGIAKGSGMIAPNMATMLAYVFTDADLEQSQLQAMVKRQNHRSFNCITVDGDTSTSDTLLVCATRASNVRVDGHEIFEEALGSLMLDLAQQIVRDGEGATKFITIEISGADTDAGARVHAHAIANSPLVKTAISGEDPNWGRVVMAIGKSGAQADRDLLRIWFGNVLVAEDGWVSENYSEKDARRHLRQAEVSIKVDFGLGLGKATVWTCDFSKRYIEINADYRS
ncbi:MAG: bifunctional glutamate N-acetyltransferase/amino-acid acetyltransferase ArgJ [Aestuariivita sp.]|nr:bifunctional glutamate N-acetyltransferase/amino-acid acetyltransferase ArgJ [Aestuariivita sp.]MCY4203115.1 bifunctional glutamate N-acetyltransferase/amino-acid acetyltransferase ArgJ [Aestuariivita sp.]